VGRMLVETTRRVCDLPRASMRSFSSSLQERLTGESEALARRSEEGEGFQCKGGDSREAAVLDARGAAE
jgi:hypothetical protein